MAGNLVGDSIGFRDEDVFCRRWRVASAQDSFGAMLGAAATPVFSLMTSTCQAISLSFEFLHTRSRAPVLRLRWFG